MAQVKGTLGLVKFDLWVTFGGALNDKIIPFWSCFFSSCTHSMQREIHPRVNESMEKASRVHLWLQEEQQLTNHTMFLCTKREQHAAIDICSLSCLQRLELFDFSPQIVVTSHVRSEMPQTRAYTDPSLLLHRVALHTIGTVSQSRFVHLLPNLPEHAAVRASRIDSIDLPLHVHPVTV